MGNNIGGQTEYTSSKSNYLFCLVAIVLCVRHILQLLGFSAIASVLFEMLYVLTALFVVVSMLKKLTVKYKLYAFVLFVLGSIAVLYLTMTMLFKYRTYVEQSLAFLLTFPLILCCDVIKMPRKNAKLYFTGMVAVGIVLAILAFVPSSYKEGILMLYTLNGNQAGLLYMSVFFAIYVFQRVYKKSWFLYVVLALLFYGCWRTESRTSIIACVLIVLLNILMHKATKWKKITFVTASIAFVAIPFLVSFLVELLGADFKILGASAWTGREDLWPAIIEATLTEPFVWKIDRIVHDLYGVDLGAHNAWLSVAWNYSLPIAIMFLAAVFHMGKILAYDIDDKKTYVLVACFAGGLLHMSFEAAIICGALDYSLYFLLTMFGGTALLKGQEGKQ